MLEQRQEASGDKDQGVIFRQKREGDADAERSRVSDPAGLDGSQKIVSGPRPDRDENDIGVVLVSVGGIERRQDQQRPGGGALGTTGEVADEVPRTQQANAGVQRAQQPERPLRIRKNLEPQGAEPGPEWRMLVVAELEFLAPGISLGHVM